MTLTPVYKSADQHFNHEAARRAYDLVMKMDEDEARAFTTCVVYDTLMSDLDANYRTLQRHLDGVIAKRCERLAKALDKTYVNKALAALESDDGQFFNREELLAYAGALGVISKAVKTPYDYGYVFDPEQHPRGPGGQFKSKVRYSGSDKPVKAKGGKAAGVPQHHQKKSDQAKRAYQEGHAQLSTFMHQFDGGETDFLIDFKDKNDNIYTQRVSGNKVPDWDPDEEKPVRVEARPTTLTAGGAAFGLVSALGGDTARAATVGGVTRQIDRSLPDFARDWSTPQGDARNSNDRLYGRIETGSKYLGQVAPVGSKTQMAASFGEFVGRHGPQAEQVLGPTTRKTMYRYRGTEKTPEPGLRAAAPKIISEPMMTAEQRKDLTARQNRMLNAAQRSKGSQLTSAERTKVVQAATAEWKRRNQDPRAMATDRRQLTRVNTVKYFANPDNKKIPSQKYYDLQLASGHTPPSEGVIIDAKGDIVTQAVGYGDDHYLPFNLKNLKGLKGGEYVRTRSVGGPTSEDIYTGLVSGARAVTVVSRSGTFTVEFDDTFRGGRRYNQKASRMVGRYEQLLDAVKSEQVKRTGIPDSVHAEIRERVNQEAEQYPSLTKDPRWRMRRERAMIDDFKADPYITDKEEKRLYEEALKDNTSDPKLAAAAVAAKKNKMIEDRALNYQLNGAGYEAALYALREQFPYYLKEPHHEPLRHAERYETELDRGYVRPRHNRPTAAQAGYFDERITGRGKFSASEADYQNFRARRAEPDQQNQSEAESQPAQTEETGGRLRATGTTNDAVADAVETAQDQEDLRKARQGARDFMRQWAHQEGTHTEFAQMNDADLDRALADPKTQHKFDRAAAELASRVSTASVDDTVKEGATEVLWRLERAKEEMSKQPYDPAKHRMGVGKAPYKFPGIKKSTPKDQLQMELDQLDSKHAQLGLNLSKMKTDQQFVDLLLTMHEIRRRPDDALTPQGVELYRNIPGGLKDEQSERIQAAGKDAIDTAIDDTHKARRLRYNIQRHDDKAVSVPSQQPAPQQPGTPASPPDEELESEREKLVNALRFITAQQDVSEEDKGEANQIISGLSQAKTRGELEAAQQQIRELYRRKNQ